MATSRRASGVTSDVVVPLDVAGHEPARGELSDVVAFAGGVDAGEQVVGVDLAVVVGGDPEGGEQGEAAGVVDVEFGCVLTVQRLVLGRAVRCDAERDAHLMLLVRLPLRGNGLCRCLARGPLPSRGWAAVKGRAERESKNPRGERSGDSQEPGLFGDP